VRACSKVFYQNYVGGRGRNLLCVVRVCSNDFNKIMWVGEGVIYSV
jgi:hypothetical protein